MGTLLIIFFIFAVFFILYIRAKEDANDDYTIGDDLNALKTRASRFKKMIETEDDQQSIEEIQSSLAELTQRLEKNNQLLKQIEENNKEEEFIPSPYHICDNIGQYRFDNIKVSLTYRSAGGEVSNRHVDLSSFDGYYLGGYCHLRKSYRTFIINRVLTFADGETGEVIVDPCVFLQDKYMNSPAFAIDTIFENYRDVLRVLLYVVKVDGRYTKDEKILVRDLVRTLNNSKAVINDKSIDELMNDIEIPSIHSFRMAVGKVLKLESLPFDIIDEIENIIAADGTIDSDELETLNYVKKRLNKLEKV